MPGVDRVPVDSEVFGRIGIGTVNHAGRTSVHRPAKWTISRRFLRACQNVWNRAGQGKQEAGLSVGRAVNMHDIDGGHQAVGGQCRPDHRPDRNSIDKVEPFGEFHVPDQHKLLDTWFLQRFNKADEVFTGAVK